MPFYDGKSAGPMVLEIPPVDSGSSITGSIDEACGRRSKTSDDAERPFGAKSANQD